MDALKYRPRRIAFVGPRRVGKDTAGLVLREAGFEKASFIRPMREMIEAYLVACGVRWDSRAAMTDGPLKEAPTDILEGKSVRFFMQRLGVMMRDQLGEDIFVNRMLDWIKRTDPYNEIPMYVTDCRFPNEEKVLRDRGWTLVRIVRPKLAKTADDEYVTETAHEQILTDHLLTNDFDSVEEFQRYVEKWAKDQGIITS